MRPVISPETQASRLDPNPQTCHHKSPPQQSAPQTDSAVTLSKRPNKSHPAHSLTSENTPATSARNQSRHQNRSLATPSHPRSLQNCLRRTLPPKNPASQAPCFQIKHPPRSTTGPLRIPNLSANAGSTDPELRCRWKKTEKQSREGTSGLENRNRIRQDQVTDNNIAIARTQRSAHPSESVAPDELAMRANRAIRKLPIQNHGHRPKTKAHKPTQPHGETLSPGQNTPQNRREPADCRARNEGNRNQKGPWKTGRQKPAPSSSTSEPAGTRPAQQHT